MTDRDVLHAISDDADDLIIDEARRGARLVLPFTLSTLAIVWLVLGDATRGADVRAAFVATLGAALVRLLTFRMVGRQKNAVRTAGSSRAWRLAFGASSWLLSVSFASTYVASAHAVSAVQLLLLTVVAGHASGDQVLASFAKLAQSAVRAGDIVARWGGEEFLMVMEVENRQAAHAVAERLRATVASTPVADASGRAMAVTCSIGATLFPLDPKHADELTWRETLELADGSLYRAKSAGRNRTAWAKADPEFTPRQLLDHERENDAETLTFRKAA